MVHRSKLRRTPQCHGSSYRSQIPADEPHGNESLYGAESRRDVLWNAVRYPRVERADSNSQEPGRVAGHPRRNHHRDGSPGGCRALDADHRIAPGCGDLQVESGTDGDESDGVSDGGTIGHEYLAKLVGVADTLHGAADFDVHHAVALDLEHVYV